MTDQLVSVLIPVLNRPEAARPLLDSLADEPRATAWFLVSPNDPAETTALFALKDEYPSIEASIVTWLPGPGDYARKINHGYGMTDAPWLLLGADDLRFHPGWLDAAIEVAEETGCGVVATNDLGNPQVVAGHHATHPLVARWYVDECGASADGPGVVYHEGYGHQFCDTELTEVAKSRGCFAAAPLSLVEHLHPFWGKGDRDATYEKGLASGDADRQLFNRRRRLWA